MLSGSDCNNKRLREATEVKRRDTVGLSVLRWYNWPTQKPACRLNLVSLIAPGCVVSMENSSMPAHIDSSDATLRQVLDYDAFLSHASEDKPWCERLAERLRDEGVRV